jgi:catechol 2,3-dioxygenase-like lactoylglutathione lyase family enzyme
MTAKIGSLLASGNTADVFAWGDNRVVKLYEPATWAKRVAFREAANQGAVEPILVALAGAGWPLFMDPERKWYRTGDVETGVHQFLVQDPDGYLIRFSAYLGERPLGAESIKSSD